MFEGFIVWLFKLGAVILIAFAILFAIGLLLLLWDLIRGKEIKSEPYKFSEDQKRAFEKQFNTMLMFALIIFLLFMVYAATR